MPGAAPSTLLTKTQTRSKIRKIKKPPKPTVFLITLLQDKLCTEAHWH